MCSFLFFKINPPYCVGFICVSKASHFVRPPLLAFFLTSRTGIAPGPLATTSKSFTQPLFFSPLCTSLWESGKEPLGEATPFSALPMAVLALMLPAVVLKMTPFSL